MLLRQCKLDVHGKEVQSAATYSYLWSADQIGHMGVGIVLNFLLVMVVYYAMDGLAYLRVLGSPPDEKPHALIAQIVGFLITTWAVSHWEYNAYTTDVKNARPPFVLDKRLLGWNAVTAAGYMVIGAVIGWGFHRPGWQAWVIVALALVVAFGIAPPWLRQKIIWQKAGLPYLFRLADTESSILEEPAREMEKLIAGAAPPGAPPAQVVLAGPIGSGRTSLAAAIGTEFAFRKKSVRYLTLDRLIEFATAPSLRDHPPTFGDDPGPVNIKYWTWTEAQVLVIDDIGPVIGALPDDDILPRFRSLLEGPLASVRAALAVRHTVWILGDIGTGGEGLAMLAQFAETVAWFCDGEYMPNKKPLAVLLSAEDEKPQILNRPPPMSEEALA
jgi:hypothetical protein